MAVHLKKGIFTEVAIKIESIKKDRKFIIIIIILSYCLQQLYWLPVHTLPNGNACIPVYIFKLQIVYFYSKQPCVSRHIRSYSRRVWIIKFSAIIHLLLSLINSYWFRLHQIMKIQESVSIIQAYLFSLYFRIFLKGFYS